VTDFRYIGCNVIINSTNLYCNVQVLISNSTCLREERVGSAASGSVLVTRMGFGLVIGFISHLQLVTTITYNTVTDFHSIKHSTPIFSVLFPLVFTIRFLATDLNAGIITVSQSQYHCTKSVLITINTALPLFLNFMIHCYTHAHAHTHTLVLSW
jgi:hypothetical protein